MDTDIPYTSACRPVIKETKGQLLLCCIKTSKAIKKHTTEYYNIVITPQLSAEIACSCFQNIIISHDHRQTIKVLLLTITQCRIIFRENKTMHLV